MIKIFVGVVLGTLGAWFLLPIDFAEVILTFFVFSAAAIGIYWVATGSLVRSIGMGIFMLLVIVLGSIRVSIEKLSAKVAALLPPPFGTNGNRTPMR